MNEARVKLALFESGEHKEPTPTETPSEYQAPLLALTQAKNAQIAHLEQ